MARASRVARAHERKAVSGGLPIVGPAKCVRRRLTAADWGDVSLGEETHRQLIEVVWAFQGQHV